MVHINPISPSYRNSKRKRENDNDFLAWLRTQPSALSGQSPTEACHYRTAKNSGIGCKPLYSAIPLTSQEHKLQHSIGQYNFMPRSEWERLVELYVRKYKEQVKINIVT